MKRLFLIFGITYFLGVHALTGPMQIKVETLYDTYREKYLTPLILDQQVETLAKTQTLLAGYKQKSSVTAPLYDMVSYLEHLLCQTQSLLTGNYCQDNYHPLSLLTTNKKNLTLSQIRTLLTGEHSRRRVERSLGKLSSSETLHAIAQNYALKLCDAGTITHTLNGSTLEQRYSDGDYEYIWGGENLGFGQENILELLDQLTTSIHHRENMYQEEFREIGIGQCKDIWVLNYGSR